MPGRVRAPAGAALATVALCAAMTACSSTGQGAVAGNTRANQTTTQASGPVDSSGVLTPESSPQQPSGRADPGATESQAPSPNAGQTTALRTALHDISPALDTDQAATHAVAVCSAITSGAAQTDVATVVRQQFGSALDDTTVVAVQNAITGNFCTR